MRFDCHDQKFWLYEEVNIRLVVDIHAVLLELLALCSLIACVKF